MAPPPPRHLPGAFEDYLGRCFLQGPTASSVQGLNMWPRPVALNPSKCRVGMKEAEPKSGSLHMSLLIHAAEPQLLF